MDDFIAKLIALLNNLLPKVWKIEIAPLSLFPSILEPTTISDLPLSNGSNINPKSEGEYVPSPSINTTISASEWSTASRIAFPFPFPFWTRNLTFALLQISPVRSVDPPSITRIDSSIGKRQERISIINSSTVFSSFNVGIIISTFISPLSVLEKIFSSDCCSCLKSSSN
jgi:hypothetical protein